MSSICAIVPTFNRAKLLPLSLDSIFAQTRPVDEVIVVNDGSTDETLQVLKPYHDRLRIVTQANAGKAAAMNAGLAETSADYIWFFDDDDLAATNGIAPLAAALDADPSLDMAYGMHRKFLDDKPDELFPPEFWGEPGFDRPIVDFLGNTYPFQAAMLVRRRLYERVGPFLPELTRAQDVEMMIRLGLYGTGLYVPHIVFYQRGHTGARGRPGQLMSAQEALLKAVSYDQKGMLLHRDEMTPDRVQPSYAASLPPDLQERAAYLQRACMFARRALWPAAIDDIKSANDISSEPAPAAELAHAGLTVVKAQMWDLLCRDPESLREMHRLTRLSTYTKAIVMALLRPMPWHIRTGFSSGQATLGWQRLRLLMAILGTKGAIGLCLDKVLK